MSWPTAKLSDVAPAKPLKRIKGIDESRVLQITLDHIESDSGRLLKYNYAPASEAGNSTHWFDERHVLYSKLRPYLNKVYLPDEIGLCTTELVPMLPNEKVLDRRYLAYFLKSRGFVDWVSSQTAGAKMPRVSMKIFWDFEIPLPPLTEQKRIVAILDKADAVRRKRQQAIHLADEFLRSVFLDMFGDFVDSGWKQSSVEKIASKKGGLRTGPFGSQLLHSEFVESGISVLGIDNAVDNNFKWGKQRFITPEKYERLKKYTVYPGDVLITIMGTCGRCAVLPEDIPVAINTKHLCCITVDASKCLPDYLHAFFLYHKIARNYLKAATKGAIMDGLNMGIIKEMPILLPPLKLQHKFSAIKKKQRSMLGTMGESDASSLFGSISSRFFFGSF